MLLAVLAATAQAQADDFKVVAHRELPGTLTVAQVSRLFLKKETRWPDGTPAKPVVPRDGPLHQAFSLRIHGKPASAIHAYWNQMIFSGKDVPPREFATTAEILDFVSSTPGAIGFIPAAAVAPTDVRVVALKD